MTYRRVDHVAVADDRLLHQFKVGEPPVLPNQPTTPPQSLQATQTAPETALGRPMTESDR